MAGPKQFVHGRSALSGPPRKFRWCLVVLGRAVRRRRSEGAGIDGDSALRCGELELDVVAVRAQSRSCRARYPCGRRSRPRDASDRRRIGRGRRSRNCPGRSCPRRRNPRPRRRPGRRSGAVRDRRAARVLDHECRRIEVTQGMAVELVAVRGIVDHLDVAERLRREARGRAGRDRRRDRGRPRRTKFSLAATEAVTGWPISKSAVRRLARQRGAVARHQRYRHGIQPVGQPGRRRSVRDSG